MALDTERVGAHHPDSQLHSLTRYGFGTASFTFSPKELGRFTQLRHLRPFYKFECTYADLILPPELTTLGFADCTSGSIADLRLPDSLTT
jgi:hypothetical protein